MESIDAYQLAWKDVNELLLKFFPKQASFTHKLVSTIDPTTCESIQLTRDSVFRCLLFLCTYSLNDSKHEAGRLNLTLRD